MKVQVLVYLLVLFDLQWIQKGSGQHQPVRQSVGARYRRLLEVFLNRIELQPRQAATIEKVRPPREDGERVLKLGCD
jgi:hypothetical protein